MTAIIEKIRSATRGVLSFRYFVVISSIAFLLITGFAFYLTHHDALAMHDEINANFNQQQLILARQAASAISRMLHDIEVETDALARALPGLPAASRREAMQAALGRAAAKGLVAIGLEAGPERLTVRRPANGVAPVSDPWSGGPGGAPVEGISLGPLRVEQADGRALVTSVVSTPTSTGRLVAKLAVSELVRRATRRIRSGETGYAWVIDQAGLFLWHPEQEFIGRRAQDARHQRKPDLDFQTINRIMKEQMERGEEGAGAYVSGWHEGREGEITKLIAFTPVKARGRLAPGRIWSVAVVAPTSEVADVVSRVRLRHYLVSAALVVGLFLFGLLVAYYQHGISQAFQEQAIRSERDRQKSEKIYQRVVEQSTDLIFLLDLEGRILLLNGPTMKMASTMLGDYACASLLTPADLENPGLYVGRRLEDAFRPEDAARIREHLDRLLETGESQEFEHRAAVLGSHVHLSTKLIRIRDEQNCVVQILGITRDQTERQTLEQRIYHTEKLASIGTLAAGVAHELNNPLAIILGFTDLLVEQFEPGSAQYKDLKAIEDNAYLAKKVVENLLGFARITEGLEDTVDIKHCVDTVEGIVRNTLMTKKIELHVNVPEDLDRVRGDSREFQQVIFNLINNSVAAMEGEPGVLTISAWMAEDYVHLSVTDTGKGIGDEIKPRIFDPFFTTKKVGEGTGLGLSLCYGIVKKYGGKMSFSSVAAQDGHDAPSGATFVVSMPRLGGAPPNEHEDEAHAATHPGRG